MIETRRLGNVVIFFQTTLSFPLSKKICWFVLILFFNVIVKVIAETRFNVYNCIQISLPVNKQVIFDGRSMVPL